MAILLTWIGFRMRFSSTLTFLGLCFPRGYLSQTELIGAHFDTLIAIDLRILLFGNLKKWAKAEQRISIKKKNGIKFYVQICPITLLMIELEQVEVTFAWEERTLSPV